MTALVAARSGTPPRILPDDSLPGRMLHVLFGYVDQPSGMQVAVYICVLAGIFLATRDRVAPRLRQNLMRGHSAG